MNVVDHVSKVDLLFEYVGLLTVAAVVYYALGYAWYRLVTFPRALREWERLGYIVVGEDLLGDPVGWKWDEYATNTGRPPQPQGFGEWLMTPVPDDDWRP